MTTRIQRAGRLAAMASMRLGDAMGWSGLVGVVLLVGALGLGATAWSERAAEKAVVARAGAASRHGPGTDIGRSALTAATALPKPADVPQILQQIQRLALANRLDWAAADYKLLPSSETQPASLELRTGFKAPYPQTRDMLAEVLHQVPASTLRGLSMSRSSADAPAVDSKVVIAVLLQDATPAISPASSASAGTGKP